MRPTRARTERTPRAQAWGVLAVGLLVLPLAACAAVGLQVRPHPEIEASADRGRFYALRSCAGCHAVADLGASPDGHAPAFRNLEDRVAQSELSRRLADLSTGGHGEMPPIYMSPDEIRDLVAYVTTLRRSAPRKALGRARRI